MIVSCAPKRTLVETDFQVKKEGFIKPKTSMKIETIRIKLVFSCALVGLYSLTPRLLVAEPLDNWHVRYTNAAISSLNAITYGNGVFVTVGSGGTVLTSPTGESWTPQSSGTSQSLQSVAFGDGTFVVVGAAATILSSPDGTNWTARNCPGISGALEGIGFGGGMFVVSGSSKVAVSTDGINWNAYPIPATYGFASSFVTYGNGLFILEDAYDKNLSSINGTDWAKIPSGSSFGIYTVGFGKGIFVSVDIHSRVFTSSDGSTWTQSGTIELERPSQIAFGSGHFVSAGNGPIIFSRDAATWNNSQFGSMSASRGIAYGNGTFVAVGFHAAILQSDPVLWIETVSANSLSIFGQAGKVYVVECASNPQETNEWQVLTNIVLDGAPNIWTDPQPSDQPQRFYRVKVQPQP